MPNICIIPLRSVISRKQGKKNQWNLEDRPKSDHSEYYKEAQDEGISHQRGSKAKSSI